MRRKVQLIAFALMIGGVSQITGCQPIQIPVPFTLNAALGGFEIKVSYLQQSQQKIFDIFAEIAGFGQSGGITDDEYQTMKAKILA